MSVACCYGPGRDGTIMAELLPKVAELCAERAFLPRDGNMSKAEHLLDRRVDITDVLAYPENYKIGVKALEELNKHDAIANPYLNAAARIVTRCVTTVAVRNRMDKLHSMNYLLPRQFGTYTRADEEFIDTVRELVALNLCQTGRHLSPEQKELCNSVWVQERRTVDYYDILDHICHLQDVHVHLNTCDWSSRAWSVQTWGRDEKPFRMSLNQAISENKNTNDTAMRVSESYEEWEIDVAWHVAHEVIWKCYDDNDAYWRYIQNNFDGSEELFNKWVQEEYEMESPQPEAWGTPEQMEMFADEKEMHEYYDDLMDEQDRVIEEARFRMENDW